MDPSRLGLFFVAALILLLTPGPAVLYIIARTIDQGKRAGALSILGLALGNMMQVSAAALGLSALMISSAIAFNAVKYAGAAYLIYLGIIKLLQNEKPDGNVEMKSANQTFYQGIVVSLLNPKSTLFFFAFLPQFVEPARSVAVQTFLLGSAFVMMGLCTDSLYVFLAGGLGRRLKENVSVLRSGRYFAGAVYLALGVTAVVTGSTKK